MAKPTSRTSLRNYVRFIPRKNLHLLPESIRILLHEKVVFKYPRG